MPHTIKNQFSEKLTFNNFLEAHKRASKGKNNKKKLKYNVDLETNLINLINKIKNNNYALGKYRQFTINEPKERIIKSLPYQDRIVHQWYIEEFIKPYFIPRFINDNYACIDNKGTHKAVEKTQLYMKTMKRKHKKYYVLKADIKKFFYNIDKEILFNIMKKYIKDKKMLEFTKIMIYDGSGQKGLPIGNYTSQYFANIYLNELDHFVKHDLKIKYYVRYMDDFIILLPNKKESSLIYKKIEKFLNNKLLLEFNPKTRYFPSTTGINFCGYLIYEKYLLIRKNNKLKILKKINEANKSYKINRLNIKKFCLTWKSWLAHSNHSNNYTFQNKLFNLITFNELL